ncbi:MAG: ATP-binding protein [Anaerolineae bacterium]
MSEDSTQLVNDYSNEHIRTCCCAGKRFVRINVPVGHVLFGKAIPCVCQRDRAERERADRMRRRCGMSKAELERWRFETFHPEQCTPANGIEGQMAIKAMRHYKEMCETYALNPKGWIALQGGTGVGKTHLAYAIAAKALSTGKGVYAHSVPEMLNMLRGGFADDTYGTWIRELKEIELLVLDDLGAQRNTEWAQEQLYEIVDKRYAVQKPLVVTTNYNLESEDCPIEKRILSRLRDGSKVKGGLVQVVRFPVQDYRPTRRGI